MAGGKKIEKKKLEDLKERKNLRECERKRERKQREEQKWKHMDVFKDHQGRETCAFSHKP